MGRSTLALVIGVGVMLTVVMLWASGPAGGRPEGDVGASGAAPASERPGEPSAPAVASGLQAPPEGGAGGPGADAQTTQHDAAAPGASSADAAEADPRAPGLAWRSDRDQPVSTAGDVQLQPPAARPEVWDARRAEAHRAWTSAARGAVARYAQDRGWDASRAHAVSAVVSAHLAEVGAVRAAIGDGTLPPRQGREALREAAEGVREELGRLLGAADEAALRAHLQETVRGGVY